jgi:serine/threonine-protein kinase
LARAAAPDVAARLDAAGLAARLGALAAALPTPAPLPLVTPHLEDSAPIAAFHAPGIDELTETAVVGGGAAAAVGGTTKLRGAPIGTKAGPGEVFDAESDGRAKSAARAPSGGPAVMQVRRRWWRRHRGWLIAALVVVLLLVAGGLVAAFETNVFTPSHPTPNLAGMTVPQARTTLDKVHMHLAEGAPVKSITVGSGGIVSQTPKASTSLKEGSTVTVAVSDGPPNESVPSLTNMTCAQAAAALQSAHFKSVCAPGTYNNSIPAGVLVLWSINSTQNPTQAPYGSTITLVPSLGHAPVPVPNIPGSYTYSEAQAALSAVGLGAAQNQETDADVPAGNVISTSPASGAPAPYGSTVTVNVSTGPPTVPVPAVAGESVAQATAALQAAGLTVSGVVGSPSKIVTHVAPHANTSVPVGSSVQLFTG